MAAKPHRAGGAYRALTIGVSEFTEPSYPPLREASRLADELRGELAALKYACDDPAPAGWTSEAVGAAVLGAIKAAAADDVLIVHILTHGEVSDETGKLYVIGRDASRDVQAEVEVWLTAVQDRKKTSGDTGEQASPLVLFMLDTCQSGTAARLPWQGATADGSGRAWVIAACGPQEQAFNGRLTRAATSVLRRLRNWELDIAPAFEFVPLPKVAQEISAEVARLAREEGDGLPQQVTGTRLDISAVPPDLPFFRNPAHPLGGHVAPPPGTEPALASFSDGIREPRTTRPSPAGTPDAWPAGTKALPQHPGLNPDHFVDRARGHGQILAAPEAGCFTGRLDQLNELVPWMQGWHAGERQRTLSVVTGGPGVGKSALLGVLVCAAHPGLRDATKTLWNEARQAPPEIRHLVAVHARQRDLADVTGCLGRQLNAEAGAPDGPSDPAGLVAAVAAAQGKVPVIVLDALDEATGPQAIVDQLIVPLVEARRPDGTPACRVLVGTRRDGFEGLLSAAAAQGGLIDLDDTNRDQLLADLSGYVGKLLRTQPGYREPKMAGVRGAFAEAVASALARQPDDDRRWGEFLIAGLYTHSFLHATGAAPVGSADEAGSRGTDCPRTLPEVLELDLKSRRNEAELRQVLQIVTLARDAGMPASVIDRCRPWHSPLLPWTRTLPLLDDLGFYLRRGSDADGTTLYHVFHEGLAEQLRPSAEEPEDDEEILLRASLSAWEPGWSRRSAEEAVTEGMLSALGPPAARRWDLAEPYVLRHVLDHALAAYDTDAGHTQLSELLLDPEFLVHADPSVPTALQRLEGSEAAEQALKLLAGLGETASLTQRRAALALAAARAGDGPLAARLAEPPAGSPELPLRWQPRWTAGRHLSGPSMGPFWPDPTGGTELIDPQVSDTMSALATGVIDGEQVVVLGTSHGAFLLRSPKDGRALDEQGAGFARRIPRHRRQGEKHLYDARIADCGIRAICISQGNAVVAVTADGAVRSRDLLTGAKGGAACKLDDAEVVAVETAALGVRTLAALTRTDGDITIITTVSGRELDRISLAEAAVTLVVGGTPYRLVRSRPALIVGADRDFVRVTGPGAYHGVLSGHSGHITTLTTMTLDERQVAVTASQDGTVRFWDVPALREIERLDLPGPVQSVVPAGPDHLAVLCCGEVIVYARKPGGSR
jgi:hypothetical protein